MITDVVFDQIVKPMERGQVTIPLKIRKALKINSQTWLWVKLLANMQIVIEPVTSDRRSTTTLAEFVSQVSDQSQGRGYWTEMDDESVKRVRKSTRGKLKKLSQLW